MYTAEYHLEIKGEAARRMTRAWLLLGLWSLVAAGLFAVLLVLARTPVISEIFPVVDFFRVALVVHVDLSVLIWLLSMAGLFWSTVGSRSIPAWDWLSFALAAAGGLTIVAAPFLGATDPLMNNYVPLLRHPVFYWGLGLFTAGIFSQLLRFAVTFEKPRTVDGSAALRVGIVLAAVVTAVAMAAFLASVAGTPRAMDGQVYFEFVFWGGGHVLQFTHTLLMFVAWIVLAHASGVHLVLTPRVTLMFLVFLALPVITVPFLYLGHEIVSSGHRLAFTELMKYGGLSCLPLGLAIVVSLWNAQPASGEGRYLRAALVSSGVLFAAGGILGFLISGLDIVIPAHYHGSTVGVTIAFMGLCYYLLPRLGYGMPPPRLAFWQPILYCGGQLLHILGLAWTGGYGVQRKAAGAAQGVDRLAEVAGMGLMGFGGLISVIGGFLFLVVSYLAIRSKVSPEPGRN